MAKDRAESAHELLVGYFTILCLQATDGVLAMYCFVPSSPSIIIIIIVAIVI